MKPEIQEKILEASTARNGGHEACIEFVDTVRGLDKPASYEGLKVLMKTYTKECDWGTQETVNNGIMWSAPEDLSRAILEELPRLIECCRDWADYLVESVLKEEETAFIAMARKSSPQEKQALEAILGSSGFVRDYGPGLKSKVLGE